MKIPVRINFRWYDFWIGFFWDRKKRVLHFCPVPMILISMSVNLCRITGHQFSLIGGRQCPQGLTIGCSQSVSECIRCGAMHYGDECKNCSEEKEDSS